MLINDVQIYVITFIHTTCCLRYSGYQLLDPTQPPKPEIDSWRPPRKQATACHFKWAVVKSAGVPYGKVMPIHLNANKLYNTFTNKHLQHMMNGASQKGLGDLGPRLLH